MKCGWDWSQILQDLGFGRMGHFLKDIQTGGLENRVQKSAVPLSEVVMVTGGVRRVVLINTVLCAFYWVSVLWLILEVAYFKDLSWFVCIFSFYCQCFRYRLMVVQIQMSCPNFSKSPKNLFFQSSHGFMMDVKLILTKMVSW